MLQKVFLFVCWFFLKRLAESSTDVGADFIGILKINVKEFFKETTTGFLLFLGLHRVNKATRG